MRLIDPSEAEEPRHFIDDLFARPPINEAELEQRLSGWDAAEMSRLLVSNLESGLFEHDDRSLLVAAMRCLGGELEEATLEGIVRNEHAETFARSVALEVIVQSNPELAAGLVHLFPPDIAAQILDGPVTDLFEGILSDPGAAGGLADLLERFPSEGRGDLLEQLDSLGNCIWPAAEGGPWHASC